MPETRRPMEVPAGQRLGGYCARNLHDQCVEDRCDCACHARPEPRSPAVDLPPRPVDGAVSVGLKWGPPPPQHAPGRRPTWELCLDQLPKLKEKPGEWACIIVLSARRNAKDPRKSSYAAASGVRKKLEAFAACFPEADPKCEFAHGNVGEEMGGVWARIASED